MLWKNLLGKTCKTSRIDVNTLNRRQNIFGLKKWQERVPAFTAFCKTRQQQKLCECNYNGALDQYFCSLQSPVPKICTWWHQYAGMYHELLRCCKPMNGGADPNSIKEVRAWSKWNNYHQTERDGAARISLRNIVLSQKLHFQGIRLEDQLLNYIKCRKWRFFKLAFSPQINSSLTRTFFGWRRKHLEVMNGLDWFLESSVSHRPLIMAAPKGSQCIKRIPRWRECANHQFASKYYFFQFSTTQLLT